MAWWLWKTNSQWKHSKAGRCMANSGKTEAEEKLHDKRLAQITSRKVLNRKPEILLSRYFASLWPRGKNEDYNLWLFYFKQLKNCYWACQYTPMQCKNSTSTLQASCQKKTLCHLIAQHRVTGYSYCIANLTYFVSKYDIFIDPFFSFKIPFTYC